MTKPRTALDLAIFFHDTYERLAPQFGYETRPDTRQFSPSSQNGQLMRAVCEEVLRQFTAGEAVTGKHLTATEWARLMDFIHSERGWSEEETWAALRDGGWVEVQEKEDLEEDRRFSENQTG